MTSQLPKTFAEGEHTPLLGGPISANGHQAVTTPMRVEPDSQSYQGASKFQWFYDLPVRRKQLGGLLTSEAISIVGLVGVGTYLIVSGGRAQLVSQAESELAVNDIAYNIKIDQMGLGFRGQADNAAIIDAALDAAAEGAVPPEALAQVEGILRNEIAARNIEYATLVGADGRIIAGGNANRAGEVFDPEGLVTSVLSDPRQVKTSAVVSWEELQQESPSLPEGFTGQDALIRYTVTPVTNPSNQAVIGVLVSGDIVNNKSAIPESTLQAFNSGYSAVYLRQPNGNFALASALDFAGAATIEQASVNVPLSDPSILEWAVEAEGDVVSDRTTIGGNTYTVAAEAIDNFSGEPVAVIVRGTAEDSLNTLLSNSLKIQLLIAALALAADVVLATLLGRSIVTPITRLRSAATRFSRGDRRARADVYSKDEIGQLANTFNQLASHIELRESTLITERQRQTEAIELSRNLSELTLRIRRTLDFDTILSTAVEGVRELLNVDRALVYRFTPDLKTGYVAVESVGRGWKRAKGQLNDEPMTQDALERYYDGLVAVRNDAGREQQGEGYFNFSDELEVKADMVAPVLVGDELIALLCVHQCSIPRAWETKEKELLLQVSTQVGYALRQAQFLEQQEIAAERERTLNEIVSEMRSSLDKAEIHEAVVTQTRKALQSDRVGVYIFDENWSGTFVAESVNDKYPSALGTEITDPCFADSYVEKYRQGRVQATPNIQEAGLTECHMKQLAPFEVKANLVAPILSNERLIGLLIAHQCAAPRNWADDEIGLFRQIALQLGFALEQSDLFAQREQAQREAEALSKEQQQRAETLQKQLVTLLSEVEGAVGGDLTVRAEVTADEIGIVADFFNSIVESLRQVVVNVKDAAVQVNSSLGENKGAIGELAEAALKQAEDTTRTLDSVEQMTQSIQAVATNAQQAALVARQASDTAASGEAAIDSTVANILNLRDTISETAKKVKRLGESSQQISKVVSLINQIALQTNLLAINAGIEAARAGEEGQGFAVVAEEVGELAARSATATQEIEKIVETIQLETSQVVSAMEDSTAQVVEGTHLVEGAKRSLNQILEVSQQIDQLVQSISAATVSQAETSEAVSQLMRQVVDVSEQTSASSREVSQSIQDTVDIAQELQVSVGTFKVGS
ncbi:MAG: methyl-accepting chemotaxis protein [Elainellaceae cyanobacterium]